MARTLRAMTVALALVTATCGGSTARYDDSRARPIVQEADPGALEPAACADAPLLDLAQLARGERAGERVAVEGVPSADTLCTMLDCGDAKCCNQCDGVYGIPAGPRQRIVLAGLRGCHGLDCALACEPFGTRPTRRYRIVGVHAFEAAGETSIYDTSTITVERICRVADES